MIIFGTSDLGGIGLVVSNKREYLSESEEANKRQLTLLEGCANGEIEYLMEYWKGRCRG